MPGWPIRKNESGTLPVLVFPIYDADGDLVSAAAALDSERSIDQGTFADCTNEAAEIATSTGMYSLAPTQAELNGDEIAFITKTTTSGAKTAVNVIYTSDRNIDDLSFPTTSGRSTDVTAAGEVGIDLDNTVGTLDAAQIGANAITSAKIATDAIGAAQIAANAIGASELATDAIGDAQIATGAIASTAFAAGAIDAAAIANGAIDAAAIANGAIDAATFAANAIDDAAIAADAFDGMFIRDIDQVEASAPVHSITSAILKAVSRIRDNAGTLEIYRTNGTTIHMSQTVTVDATLDPVDELTAGV